MMGEMMMGQAFQTKLHGRAVWLSAAAGIFGMMAGLLVLVGWRLEVDWLKRILPDSVPMNPFSALCFILSGFSLLLHARRVGGILVNSLALAVSVAGVLKLVSLLLGWRFLPEMALLDAVVRGDGTPESSAMAPNTALCFLLFGAALWVPENKADTGARRSEILAALVGLMALMVLIAYACRTHWLYGVPIRIPMALHTALVFLVLAIGAIFSRPDTGIMAVAMGKSAGGLLLRRMFPAMVLVFLIAGGLRVAGERHGLYAPEFGVALHAVAGIGIFGIFVVWCAKSLHLAEQVRERTEEERERFFNLSLDLMCIAGTDGYFKRVNPAFQRTLGHPTEELLSRPFLDFIHPDDIAATLSEIETLDSGQPTYHFENRYRCQDGSWKWLAWSTQPYSDERILYAVGRDVTERKKAELAIHTLNAELMRQAERLETVNQELESFSYSVSHDLRAPLRGISGFALALEEHAAATLDETGIGYLGRVRNAAERMGRLIDDLLKLSRLSRAEMKMEPVDLSEMAASIIAGYRAEEPERQVDVAISPGIRVSGDPALLRIMLDNLLGNAWKFTSKNPAARIWLTHQPAEDGKILCQVRDNGVGFDTRYAHKLFGAFQRLHSQVDFPGTGIGLATVQRIIRRHGGDVRAEGEIKGGATFGFTLTANKERPSDETQDHPTR
jgi:PAS domain S-box-containing protein